MTRINLVPVETMDRRFLCAEYYEMADVFRDVQRQQAKGLTPLDLVLPTAYCFGKGHRRFFYDKLMFLARRHAQIVAEMQRRGYKTNAYAVIGQSFPDLKAHWWGNWVPPPEAVLMSALKLEERLREIGR